MIRHSQTKTKPRQGSLTWGVTAGVASPRAACTPAVGMAGCRGSVNGLPVMKLLLDIGVAAGQGPLGRAGVGRAPLLLEAAPDSEAGILMLTLEKRGSPSALLLAALCWKQRRMLASAVARMAGRLIRLWLCTHDAAMVSQLPTPSDNEMLR